MSSEDRKGKRRLFNVSTKVEEAWYVKPELLAAKGDQPKMVVIDADNPPPPDATVTLGETDFVESDEALSTRDEDARHYLDVSLRGALLAPDDSAERASFRGVASLSEDPAPRTPLAPRDGSTPLADGEALPLLPLERRNPATRLAQLLEPGGIPPIWLAMIAFAIGVITTLIGVLIAL